MTKSIKRFTLIVMAGAVLASAQTRAAFTPTDGIEDMPRSLTVSAEGSLTVTADVPAPVVVSTNRVTTAEMTHNITELSNFHITNLGDGMFGTVDKVMVLTPDGVPANEALNVGIRNEANHTYRDMTNSGLVAPDELRLESRADTLVVIKNTAAALPEGKYTIQAWFTSHRP